MNRLKRQKQTANSLLCFALSNYFIISKWEGTINQVNMVWLTFPQQIISFLYLYLKKGLFFSMFCVIIIFTASVHSAEWAETVALHTSEFLWLLLSSGTSSMAICHWKIRMLTSPHCLRHVWHTFSDAWTRNKTSTVRFFQSTDSSVHTPL